MPLLIHIAPRQSFLTASEPKLDVLTRYDKHPNLPVTLVSLTSEPIERYHKNTATKRGFTLSCVHVSCLIIRPDYARLTSRRQRKDPHETLLFYLLVSKKSTSKENSIGGLDVSACADEEDTHEEMSLLRFRKSAHGICNRNPPPLLYTYSLLLFFFVPP